MNFIDHINELRNRLQWSLFGFLIAWCIAFYAYPIIIDFLMAPFRDITGGADLVVHSIYEGFLAKFKLSAIAGLVLSIPWFLFQAIRFIFPGLKKKERIWIGVTLMVSLVLALGALLLSYTQIIPFSVRVLTAEGFIPPNVGIMLNFQQNVNYIVQLFFYFVLMK